MNDPWMPFLAAAVALLILVFLQRWIHTHLHGVSLLLTGRPEWAVIVYAVVLFPGVFLHEASHWLAATLTGVRTGGVSLMPRHQPDGTLQLGYVEYYKGRTLGPFRESLIGAAPLIAGTAVIPVSYTHLDVYKRQSRGSGPKGRAARALSTGWRPRRGRRRRR